MTARELAAYRLARGVERARRACVAAADALRRGIERRRRGERVAVGDLEADAMSAAHALAVARHVARMADLAADPLRAGGVR